MELLFTYFTFHGWIFFSNHFFVLSTWAWIAADTAIGSFWIIISIVKEADLILIFQFRVLDNDHFLLIFLFWCHFLQQACHFSRYFLTFLDLSGLVARNGLGLLAFVTDENSSLFGFVSCNCRKLFFKIIHLLLNYHQDIVTVSLST